MAAREDLEAREVASHDPSLTPEANRLLTEEARRAVGSDTVRVPRDTPRRSREPRGGRGGIATEFGAHRILIAITFLVLLVTGAIVSLATGSWWAVVVAAVLHAVGAFVVLAILATAAKQTEHVDPSVAARLAEEGVPDPDAQLSDLVEEYAGAQAERGVGDMVTSGANEQTADPSTEPAAATVQQRTAFTPAGNPTVPAGTGSAMDRGLVKGVVIAVMVAAVARRHRRTVRRGAAARDPRGDDAHGVDLVRAAAAHGRAPRGACRPGRRDDRDSARERTAGRGGDYRDGAVGRRVRRADGLGRRTHLTTPLRRRPAVRDPKARPRPPGTDVPDRKVLAEPARAARRRRRRARAGPGLRSSIPGGVPDDPSRKRLFDVWHESADTRVLPQTVTQDRRRGIVRFGTRRVEHHRIVARRPEPRLARSNRCSAGSCASCRATVTSTSPRGALASRHGADVEVHSRHQRPFARYFRELVEALAELGHDDLVIDGEVLVHAGSGWDFAALMARLHPAGSQPGGSFGTS